MIDTFHVASQILLGRRFLFPLSFFDELWSASSGKREALAVVFALCAGLNTKKFESRNGEHARRDRELDLSTRTFIKRHFRNKIHGQDHGSTDAGIHPLIRRSTGCEVELPMDSLRATCATSHNITASHSLNSPTLKSFRNLKRKTIVFFHISTSGLSMFARCLVDIIEKLYLSCK